MVLDRRLPATNVEQLLRQRGCSCGGMLDELEVLGHRAVGSDETECHLRMTADDREEVVEVVSGAGGNAPDVGEQLRVPEIRLDPLQSAHIAEPANQTHWPPGIVMVCPGARDEPAD
jgi:hypothetical protein